MEQRKIHAKKLAALLKGVTLKDDKDVRLTIEGEWLVWRSKFQSSKATIMMRMNLNTCRQEHKVPQREEGVEDAQKGK